MSFIFLLNLREKYIFEYKDCYSYELAEFCQNCGELFSYDSICCYKTGYLTFKKFVFSLLYIDFSDYKLMLPFIYLVAGISNICNIILSIRKKRDNINFPKDYNFIDKAIYVLLSFIYLIIFFSFYSFLLFFLIVSLKIRKEKEFDMLNNNYRY